MLVGARSHADVPALAAKLRRLGADPEPFGTVGVLAARAPSGSALVAALRADPRVAYVEPDRTLRVSADPFDAVDPATGVKFTWFYDDVRAAEALAAAGGGSQRSVAVIDTGVDVGHPELAGRIARTFDTRTRNTDVSDFVGHGTFVSGLIAAIDGNGIGGKGVAGNTRLVAVRASRDGSFSVSDLIRGIEFSIRAGADVINMSLAGRGFTHQPGARARPRPSSTTCCPSRRPATTASTATRSSFPRRPSAAAAATRASACRSAPPARTGRSRRSRPTTSSSASPHRGPARPVARPACCRRCRPGPGPPGTTRCPARESSRWRRGATRYAEGTSFSAPIVSGIAALDWQVEPRLASEQVAEVLTRSARQTVGARLERVHRRRRRRRRGRHGPGAPLRRDGAASLAAARGASATRCGCGCGSRRTAPSRAASSLAGSGTGCVVSRNGGRSFDSLTRSRRNPISRDVRLRGTRANVLVATACDRNGNCGIKRLGRFRP